MKNVWKGLILGALTGAGIGLVVDLLDSLGRKGRRLSVQARDEASHLTGAVEEKIRQSDLPERARDAADKLSDKVKDAELPDKARRAADKAADKISDTLKDTDFADKAKALVDTASNKGQQAAAAGSKRIDEAAKSL